MAQNRARPAAPEGAYQCVRCGAKHPREHVESWGSNGIGTGYGPAPVCTAILGPDNQAIAEGDGLTPGHACKGQLTWRDA